MYLLALNLSETARKRFQRLRDEEAGQTMIEYALIAFLIAIGVFVLLTAVGFDIEEVFDALEEALGAGSDNDAVTTPGDEDAEPTTWGLRGRSAIA